MLLFKMTPSKRSTSLQEALHNVMEDIDKVEKIDMMKTMLNQFEFVSQSERKVLRLDLKEIMEQELSINASFVRRNLQNIRIIKWKNELTIAYYEWKAFDN